MSPFIDHGLSISNIEGFECLPSGKLALRAGATAGGYLAAAIADALRDLFLEKGMSFAFESVMSHRSKLDLIAKARRQGYRTYLYFVTTDDPELNVERVLQRIREGGHPVSEDKIRQRYFRSMELLPEAIALCDRAYLFDNSGQEMVLVAKVDEGKLRIDPPTIPIWVKKLLDTLGS